MLCVFNPFVCAKDVVVSEVGSPSSLCFQRQRLFLVTFNLISCILSLSLTKYGSRLWVHKEGTPSVIVYNPWVVTSTVSGTTGPRDWSLLVSSSGKSVSPVPSRNTTLWWTRLWVSRLNPCTLFDSSCKVFFPFHP